jgi:hypothetical protein
MSRHTGIAMGVISALVLLTLVWIAFSTLPRSNFVLRMMAKRGAQEAQRLRVRLLCETDHQALLHAGRDVLAQVLIQNVAPDGRRMGGDIAIPPRVRLPQAIRVLRPHGMVANYDGYLTIEMHGGMTHFGVRVYPTDFNEPGPDFRYGDRRLLDGLWYYDEGYLFHAEEYDKRIDTLIAENTREKGRRGL